LKSGKITGEPQEKTREVLHWDLILGDQKNLNVDEIKKTFDKRSKTGSVLGSKLKTTKRGECEKPGGGPVGWWCYFEKGEKSRRRWRNRASGLQRPHRGSGREIAGKRNRKSEKP